MRINTQTPIHTRSHTHTHTLTKTLSPTHISLIILTYTCTHACTHILHMHSNSCKLTLAHSLTDTVSYTHSHTYTHKHSCPLAHIYIHTQLKNMSKLSGSLVTPPECCFGKCPCRASDRCYWSPDACRGSLTVTRLRTGWIVQNSTGSARRWPRCRESWVKPSPSGAWETTRGSCESGRACPNPLHLPVKPRESTVSTNRS